MFLSSIISEDFRLWQPNTTVIINAPTGCGKTTFNKRILLPYAIENNKEILYASNRVALDRQVKKEVCEFLGIPYSYIEGESYVELPGITLATYQALEERLDPNNFHNGIPFYHYVVFDEIHYLRTDSHFNPKVQRILEWMKTAKCAVKIVMSATIESTLPYLDYYDTAWMDVYESEYLIIRERFSNKNILNCLKGVPERMFVYTVPAIKPKYKIWVYEELEELVEVINADNTEEKWLIFQSNIVKAKKKLADNIDKEWKLLTADAKETEEMNQIIRNNRFEAKVLITTKVLDCGVSIHDKHLKNLVVETTDPEEFLQMIGRRRLQEGEDVELNLYIPKLSQKYFSNSLRMRIEPDIEFLNMSESERLKNIIASPKGYDRAKRFCDIRGLQLIINPIAVDVLEAERQYFKKVEAAMADDEMYFVKEQLRWINAESEFSKVIFTRKLRIKKAHEELERMLLRAENHELDKEQQNTFKEFCAEKLHVILSERFLDKNRTIGKRVIEDCFKEIGLSFVIETVGGKKKGEGTKWTIRRLEQS